MSTTPVGRDLLIKILDLARWAPSGDNTQPWRFRIVSDNAIIVHGYDTRDEILYDFDGHASHIAHGALLETMRIAASAEGLKTTWKFSADAEARRVDYEVHFTPSIEIAIDPLFHHIENRVVQRRPMRLTPLTDIQRTALLGAAGTNYVVQLFESFAERHTIAELLWANAHIRLTCPEAFPVHKQIIEWGAQFSKDRIPERAVGIDPVTAKLMRWVMQSWERVDFFNRYLMGTVVPRIQLDYLPAVFCAAHVLIRPKAAPKRLEDWVESGSAMQRVWLTATLHGLYLQPEMTPVIFRWYARANRGFSANLQFSGKASELARQFECITGRSEQDPFSFFGRIGTSASPKSRSIRLSLDELIVGRK